MAPDHNSAAFFREAAANFRQVVEDEERRADSYSLRESWPETKAHLLELADHFDRVAMRFEDEAAQASECDSLQKAESHQ